MELDCATLVILIEMNNDTSYQKHHFVKIQLIWALPFAFVL